MQKSFQFKTLAMSLVAAIGLALGSVPAHAEKGEDHPEVARFPGATIANYEFQEYEEFQLLLSKPVKRDGKFTADKLLPLEGRVTYIHYELPKSASPLQVLRNYQSSLRRSGFADLFVCERPCTTENLGAFKELMKVPKHYMNYSTDNQFLAAQRGKTYVSLWVNDGGVWLHVVEKQSLDDGLMGVTGESPIAKSLNANGKVDLYGFQFDTGKAVLKDGSRATLTELGKVLQDNPTLRIEVIGHTDDVGGAPANQTLSEARAAAVADALVSGSGVASNRITTRGMGQTAPVVANTNDTSRARNRRVEVVALVQPSARAASATPGSAAAGSRAEAAAPAAGNTNGSGDLMNQASKAMEAASKLKNLFGL
jgi:OmpA-OmpF porin, OOP family